MFFVYCLSVVFFCMFVEMTGIKSMFYVCFTYVLLWLVPTNFNMIGSNSLISHCVYCTCIVQYSNAPKASPCWGHNTNCSAHWQAALAAERQHRSQHRPQRAGYSTGRSTGHSAQAAAAVAATCRSTGHSAQVTAQAAALVTERRLHHWPQHRQHYWPQHEHFNEYFVFKAEFISLYWAAEIIPISEKICFISF